MDRVCLCGSHLLAHLCSHRGEPASLCSSVSPHLCAGPAATETGRQMPGTQTLDLSGLSLFVELKFQNKEAGTPK